jgi:hypothetical protein
MSLIERGFTMEGTMARRGRGNIGIIVTIMAAALNGPLMAQESKPVPKDSVRVSIPGCTKGYVFTAGRRTEDEPGTFGIPEGMHLRMNGPKKVIAEIKGHEGSMIQIVGLMKKGQYIPDGVAVGGGVRVTAGQAPTGGGVGQIFIDIESWRPILGSCPSS